MKGSVIVLDLSKGQNGDVLLASISIAGPEPGSAVLDVASLLEEVSTAADYLDLLSNKKSRGTSSLPVALLVPGQTMDTDDLQWMPPAYFRTRCSATPTFLDKPMWIGPDIPMAFGKTVVNNTTGRGASGEHCFILLGTNVAVPVWNYCSCDTSAGRAIGCRDLSAVEQYLGRINSGKMLVLSLLRHGGTAHSTWGLHPKGPLPQLK